MRTPNLLDSLAQDLRYAIRQLAKNTGFTTTAILVLALGLCASVAIFAFVEAALIKPLPYPDPHRLVGVYERIAVIPRSNLSYQDWVDWKRLNKVFLSLEAYTQAGFIVNTPDGPQPAAAARISSGFFRTLGVAPALGRDFYPGEDQPGAPPTAVLSWAAWKQRYGGSQDVVGRKVRLDDKPYVIVGVLPATFHFAPAGKAEFWTMLNANGNCERRRSCHNLYGVARLKDGVSVETALADTVLIARQLERQYPESNRGQGANVVPLTEVIVGDLRPILLVLLAGAGLLLVIACVNVVSLLLVRAEGRRREMALRSALGASRPRIIRQFLTESVVLVASACAMGVAGAYWTMRLLHRLIPVDMMARMPFLDNLGFNLHIAVFACAIALLAAAVFAAAPLLRLSCLEIRQGLVEASRGSSGNTWRRIGSKLVVVELATAVVLLVGAGLLGRSLYYLLHVDLGFEPDHIATLTVAAPDAAYGKDPQAAALGREVVSRVSSLPGVVSVGLASQLPVSFNGNTNWIRVAGKPFHGEHNEVNHREVSSDYFRTVQARLVRGRFFTESDNASSRPVVIINRTFARLFLPGEDPIGRRIGDTVLSSESIKEIVGVVEDIREGGLDSEIWPAEYVPFNQSPDNYFRVAVKTASSERSLLPSLAATIRRIHPGIVTLDPLTMRDRIEISPAAYLHRSLAWLVGAFAGLALLLGVVGLYGVIAYSVSQRTREIGVRMALGAERRNVYALVLKEAAWLTGAGLAGGVAVSMVVAALIEKLLFGVRSRDVPTFAMVVGVLSLAAILASYVPARRAASVNPVDALRAD